jgi:ABC-type Fe3+ transport system permease subunit
MPNMKNKGSITKAAALAVCAVFVVVTLFSAAYISFNLNHTHNHKGADGCCSTCMHMQAAANLLNTLTTAVYAVAVCGLLRILLVLRPVRSRFSFSSLVTYKVRLNN